MQTPWKSWNFAGIFYLISEFFFPHQRFRIILSKQSKISTLRKLIAFQDSAKLISLCIPREKLTSPWHLQNNRVLFWNQAAVVPWASVIQIWAVMVVILCVFSVDFLFNHSKILFQFSRDGKSADPFLKHETDMWLFFMAIVSISFVEVMVTNGTLTLGHTILVHFFDHHNWQITSIRTHSFPLETTVPFSLFWMKVFIVVDFIHRSTKCRSQEVASTQQYQISSTLGRNCNSSSQQSSVRLWR